MRYATHPFLILILCSATAAGAPAMPPQSSPERLPSELLADCPDGVITTIQIENNSIFETDDPELPRYLRLAYRTANALHIQTRESVVRRDLLIRAGECYDAARVAESERLLRENQSLALARIHHNVLEDGNHELIVETRDEWSTQLDIRLSLEDGPSLEGASLRETNLLGSGQSLELFYLNYELNREYGLSYHTHQLGGRQWHLGAALGRTPAGPIFYQMLAYPFREETGRWALREEYMRYDRYFGYRLDDDDDTRRHLLLRTRTHSLDLALLHRLGAPGNQMTLGAAVSFNQLTFPGGEAALRLIEGTNLDAPLTFDPSLIDRIGDQATPTTSLRTLLLIGKRQISWVERYGFDTLRGAQDIQLGTELSIALGPSISTSHGADKIYSALDLYTAMGGDGHLLSGRVRGDLEKGIKTEAEGWNDIFGEIEALAYWKPVQDGAQTLVLRAAATGGWRTRSPFQLTLGGDFGVRGYHTSRFPGGRRVLISIEDRMTFDGPLRNFMDLGATAFLDIGRIWPGDVPFGTDSGWRAAAGIGLRNSLPSGGRRTYRIDLALPIGSGTTWRDARLILSVGELIGITPNIRRQRIEEMQRFTPRNPFYFPD